MKSLVPSHNELRTMVDRGVNDLFNDFSRYFWTPLDKEYGDWFSVKAGYPKVNIQNLSDQIVIDAAIPGLTKDSVKVEWSKGILSIKGESQNDSEKDENGYVIRELHKRSFCRSFSMPEDKFDVEKIDAGIDNGLLHVIIPKREKEIDKEEVKKIEIK